MESGNCSFVPSHSSTALPSSSPSSSSRPPPNGEISHKALGTPKMVEVVENSPARWQRRERGIIPLPPQRRRSIPPSSSQSSSSSPQISHPSSFSSHPSCIFQPSRLFVCIAFFLFLVALCPTRVHCWDKNGHEAVGMTAMSALKQRALAQLKRLMGGKDIVDVSDWAIRVNAKYNWTHPLHLQPQPPWECEQLQQSPDTCSEGRCLVSAIKHFYGRLTSKNLSNMTYPAGIRFTDADALKYLINLMGELHAPLHFGWEENRQGRDTMCSYKGEETTLWDVWESGLTATLMAERPGFWFGGWTHVNTIKSLFENEKKLWAEQQEQLFDVWAIESIKLLCTKVYKDPTSNEKLPSDKFEVTPHMERFWTQELQERILLGGARLGIVLNAILEQQEAKSLRQGSGVEVQGDDEEIGNRRPAGRVPLWIRNFATNLIILFVVLGLLVYVVQFYGSGGPSAAAKGQPAAKKAGGQPTAVEMKESKDS